MSGNSSNIDGSLFSSGAGDANRVGHGAGRGRKRKCIGTTTKKQIVRNSIMDDIVNWYPHIGLGLGSVSKINCDISKGRDFPNMSSQATRNINKPRPVQFIIQSRTKESEYHYGWICSFDYASQTPALRLVKNGQVILLEGNHFIFDSNKGPEDDKVFIKLSADFEDFKIPVRLNSNFVERLGTPAMNDAELTNLIKFGQIAKKETEQGLTVLQFRVGGKINQQYQKHAVPMSDEAARLLERLENDNPTLTLIRPTQTVCADVDKFWQQRIRVCAEYGLFPFFKDDISQSIGLQFLAWQAEPSRKLPLMPWMKNPASSGYASFPAKKSFGQTGEWEVVMSAGLIYETQYVAEVNDKYFSLGRSHEGTVLWNRKDGNANLHVRMAINVIRQGDLPMPSIVPGRTSFTLRVGAEIEPNVLPTVETKDPTAFEVDTDENDGQLPTEVVPDTNLESAPAVEGAMDIDGAMEIEGALQAVETLSVGTEKVALPPLCDIKCKVLDMQTNKNFVVSMIVPKSHSVRFAMGTKMNIELVMSRNDIPNTRQLNAIGRLALPKEEEDPSAVTLERFLRGHGPPEAREGSLSMYEECFNKLSVDIQETFRQYAMEAPLNGPQRDTWNSVLNSTFMINQVQGPPGTGKTFLDACIAISAAMNSQKVLMVAPTNKACVGILQSVKKEMDRLIAINHRMAYKLKVVVFPTMASLKYEFQNPDEFEQEGADFVEQVENDELGKGMVSFKLWSHIASFVANAYENPYTSPTDKSNAFAWIQTLDLLRGGGVVHYKQVKKFMEDAKSIAQKVMADSAVKIVISTSNNSAQLMEYDFRPSLLIIDESAFATEQDSCVPLAFKAKRLLLSGDHEQLKPICQSRGNNVFDKQMGMSLFERVIDTNNVPLFRLKINYRMHTDIAEFPGMLSYGWLGCGDNTYVVSDQYAYIASWWDTDATRLQYGNQRRSADWGNPNAGKSIRRLFFNVKTGRSVVAADSTSMINYANIYTICELVLLIALHCRSAEFYTRRRISNLQNLAMKDISILAPYSEQASELQAALKLILLENGIRRFPTVNTVSSIQGGENKIIILDLTVANPRHGSLVGFIKDFHLLNVGITRAQDVLFMVGNLDAWRSELQPLAEGFGAKKMAYLVMDVLDKGDVIDVVGRDRLPASLEEAGQDVDTWSKVMPAASLQPFKGEAAPWLERKVQNYGPAQAKEFEAKMLEGLHAMRAKSAAFQKTFEETGTFETPLFNTSVKEEKAEMAAEAADFAKDNSDDEEDEDRIKTIKVEDGIKTIKVEMDW